MNTIKFETLQLVSAITRPANTTQYTAGDVISNVTSDAHNEFDASSNGPFRGTIEGARCDSSANQSTKPDLELWLFSSDITAVEDNSAFAPSDAEMLTRIAVIEFPVADWKVGNAGSGADGNACCDAVLSPAIPFIASSQKIYGQLVARNAYTPVSGEIFTVTLTVALDRINKVY